MRTSLNVWQPSNGPVRIYVNGTNRDHNKLFICDDNGKIAAHSKNIDGTAKYIRGNIYDKRDKDRQAIWDTLQGFGFDHNTPFSEVLAAANGEVQLVEVIPHD